MRSWIFSIKELTEVVMIENLRLQIELRTCGGCREFIRRK